jgi:hypothetical protein
MGSAREVDFDLIGVDSTHCSGCFGQAGGRAREYDKSFEFGKERCPGPRMLRRKITESCR